MKKLLGLAILTSFSAQAAPVISSIDIASSTIPAGSSFDASAQVSGGARVIFYLNKVIVCDIRSKVGPYQCKLKAPSTVGSAKLQVSAYGDGVYLAKSLSLNIVEAQVSAPAPVTEVYPGCEAIPTSIARSITIDAAAGDSLQKAINEKRVLPGDKVLVKGNQGSLIMNKFSHPDWVGADKWLQVEGSNATFSNISLRNMSRMHFSKVLVTGAQTGNLVETASAEHIVLSNAQVLGAADSSQWTVEQWIAAPNGIMFDNSSCTSVTGSLIKNVRFGFSATTRALVAEESSIKSLFKNNELRNISADFIRPIGSDVTIEGNKGYDGYLSATDGDGNHDDFVQGFALKGYDFSNLKVINNYFIETTDINRKFNSTFQGISSFDGVYSNFLIKGNTVIAGAYHGISMYNGKNGIIENNTVASSRPLLDRNLRISTPNGVSNVIRNNLTNNIIIVDGNTYSNNAVISSKNYASHVNAYDPIKGIYDLRFLSTSPYSGMGIGAP